MKSAYKVCHVTVGHNPTDDRIFYKEACSLARHGYRVAIVARQTTEQLPKIEGITFLVFPDKGYFQNIWQAYQLAKSVRADLYHLHEFELLPFGLFLKYKYKRSVVYDAHETIFWFFMDFSRRSFIIRLIAGSLAQTLEYLTVRGVDYLVTVTPWVEARFKRWHPRRAIVYNFPIVELFQPAAQPPDNPIILYHGQLVAGRNIELMIAAMLTVRKANPDATLLLVGNASAGYLTELRQLTDSYHLNNRVQILPPVAYGEIPALLRHATIGLAAMQPNESYKRSIQVKPFEFMAMGIPVLACRVPSIEKYIAGCGAGIVVDPLTPENLGQQINYLLQRPDVRKAMGERGRVAVVQQYNWHKTLPTLLQVYKAVLRC